ncbi:B3 DNA binding domain-containing protein [Cynara cardunculus var. scolymus]|uniref:B3 DNA binding domain-containing protein n=2 Tax=Cynara cardunculus var. scolymus TaxID=59895 RepID=A0A103XZL7_CYNCS|nr:B3 DNA binding domain-containing protein [Cynara cardunculus var. scolymus]
MGGRKFYLGIGFRALVVANGLKEGDVFKFELIENKKNKPPVVNFSCNGNSRMPKEGEDDHARPYFISKLKSYCLRKTAPFLHLPIEFAKKNGLLCSGEMILRNGEDERLCIVELKNHKNKYIYIGRGWKDFCVANGLKEGDCFKFEIVDNIDEKLVVNFYVLKNP